MQEKIYVAGTSSKGSSYTDRVIKQILSNDDNFLDVVIGKGEYQKAVANKVNRNINQLNSLLMRQQGCTVVVNVELEK